MIAASEVISAGRSSAARLFTIACSSPPEVELRIGLDVHDTGGLVSGYRLDCCRPVSLQQDPSEPSAGPTWLHFNLADGRARAWINDRSKLPPTAVGEDGHGFAWVGLGIISSILVSLALLRGSRVL